MNEKELQTRLSQIRVLALDVDGVLTDGGIWWGPDGEEWKRFCFADIMGLSLARRAGLIVGLISGEDSPLVDRYAAKLSIPFVAKKCRDKAAALRDLASSSGVALSAICYIGDDVNDLSAMEISGVSAAPANAANIVLAQATIIAKHAGGNGAVREIVDSILTAKGLDSREVFARS